MFLYFTRLWNITIDLLFPPNPLVRELLRMDPFEFLSRADRSQNRAGKEILSLFDYRDPLVREAVWELKYHGNKKIARLLAAMLYDEILAFLFEYAPLTHFTEPLLIPIPLSRARERERGFNQCELLVAELIRLDVVSPISPKKGSTAVLGRRGVAKNENVGLNFTLSLALTKIKDTPSQTKAENRESRMKNLANCFSVKNPELIQGRNIILIDDVATTGATLEEARRILRKSGARKVIAFTVAH